MSRTAAAIAGWLSIVTAALMLSALAAQHDTLPGDVRITDWVQDRPLPGDTVSDLVQAITSTEVVLATGAAAVLVLWLRGYRRQAVLLACGLVALGIVQPAVKAVVDRPRPEPELIEVRSGYESSSFPSGHLMSATVLYAFLLYLASSLPFPRGARYVLGLACGALVLLPGLVGVWLGVHWPSDIVGGWLWALVLVLPLVAADFVARRAGMLDFPER